MDRVGPKKGNRGRLGGAPGAGAAMDVMDVLDDMDKPERPGLLGRPRLESERTKSCPTQAKTGLEWATGATGL
jgi:hypothetical protein